MSFSEIGIGVFIAPRGEQNIIENYKMEYEVGRTNSEILKEENINLIP